MDVHPVMNLRECSVGDADSSSVAGNLPEDRHWG